ncbi:maleylacetate reductase [Pseudonocardia asaccharolytica]|uniref:Maleylacetate reductase n=1 Tax=Pseudonocardia asaccharolytica DSM 44247 = NBRC 16224 TaxID=1123024 RepID=A0A511D8H2_9PSEU|nr:maleylacetate reductase [Pseudonocardia asaccharolytica]GEL19238.1 maleylacetate reductase [Pseudonocardia asaccharolytica DSM 44247 = NBRC 16224]
MRDFENFEYEALPGRIVFGAGAARTRLAAEVERLGSARLLVICSERDAPLADALTAPFARRVAGRFTEVRQHVPVDSAARARARAAESAADGVLSIGGGSATGTAKAVALTTGLPVVAVPTTYAGSEVTPLWGLTEEGRKTTGTDPVVLPRTVVYDPELTLGLPVELSVTSGFNALAHCVDALWAPRRNPVGVLFAEEGIRALGAGLPTVAADPADPRARSDLLYGAYLAGTALATAGAGLHHKICHVLGGAFDLPHAATHAVVLPHVLAFNAPYAPGVVHRIGRALGADDPVAGLRALAARLGVPRGLRELGLRADQADEAARLVADAAPPGNPGPVDHSAMHTLLRTAWSGGPAAAG